MAIAECSAWAMHVFEWFGDMASLWGASIGIHVRSRYRWTSKYHQMHVYYPSKMFIYAMRIGRVCGCCVKVSGLLLWVSMALFNHQVCDFRSHFTSGPRLYQMHFLLTFEGP